MIHKTNFHYITEPGLNHACCDCGILIYYTVMCQYERWDVHMPDPAVHASFGQEVLHKLSGDIRSVLREEIYMFAQYGPDPWFTYQFWRRHSGRGRRMHTEQTGVFLLSLARRAKEGSSREKKTNAQMRERTRFFISGFLRWFFSVFSKDRPCRRGSQCEHDNKNRINWQHGRRKQLPGPFPFARPARNGSDLQQEPDLV